jgi:hypothetical protein
MRRRPGRIENGIERHGRLRAVRAEFVVLESAFPPACLPRSGSTGVLAAMMMHFGDECIRLWQFCIHATTITIREELLAGTKAQRQERLQRRNRQRIGPSLAKAPGWSRSRPQTRTGAPGEDHGRDIDGHRDTSV